MSNEPHPQQTTHTRFARRWHRQILLACTAVLAASAVLQVSADDRVVVPGLSRHPFPATCLSQRMFGVDCPGCGLTRSFVHLAHRRWHAAWSAHRLGWLAFLAVAIQVPYRLLLIRRARWQP